MPKINIQVRNKIAVAEKAVYICGNSDYVVNFDFDSEWDEYQTKTARFTYEGRYTDVVFTGSQCEIPVISDTYSFSVGVFAGELHTTTPTRVACKKSILCGGGVPADPTPDVYTQIMEMLDGLSGVDPEMVAHAVESYLTENPVEVTDVVKTVNGTAPDESGNVEINVDVPVESVNGKTGAVELTAEDVGGFPAVTSFAAVGAVAGDYSGTTPGCIVKNSDIEGIGAPALVLFGTRGHYNVPVWVYSSDGKIYRAMCDYTNGIASYSGVVNVASVNGATPDDNGNVEIAVDSGVKSVNGLEPEEDGSIEITPADIGAQPEDYYVRFGQTASGEWVVDTATGYAQTLEAYNAGRTIRGLLDGIDITFKRYIEDGGVFLFQRFDPTVADQSTWFALLNNNTVEYMEIPAQGSFPNPNALTFTGAVEATYDGSEAVTVNIPEGGSGGGSAYQVLIDATVEAGVSYINCFEIPENANVLFLHISCGTGGDLNIRISSTETIEWSNAAYLGNPGNNHIYVVLYRNGSDWMVCPLIGCNQGIYPRRLEHRKYLAISYGSASGSTAETTILGGVLA